MPFASISAWRSHAEAFGDEGERVARLHGVRTARGAGRRHGIGGERRAGRPRRRRHRGGWRGATGKRRAPGAATAGDDQLLPDDDEVGVLDAVEVGDGQRRWSTSGPPAHSTCRRRPRCSRRAVARCRAAARTRSDRCCRSGTSIATRPPRRAHPRRSCANRRWREAGRRRLGGSADRSGRGAPSRIRGRTCRRCRWRAEACPHCA